MDNDRIHYSHDAELQAAHDGTMLTPVFLTFGPVIGAALVLLFAPSSGKTVRHDLAKGVEEGLHTEHETIEPLVKRIEEKFADLRKSIEARLK